jgi:hypothetical protein
MSMHKKIAAGVAATALLLTASIPVSAGMYVKDPISLFGGNGRYWIPRDGSGKGVIRLNPDHSVYMVWNGEPYNGTWQMDGDRVMTMWDGGVPFKAPSWRVKMNKDPMKQYTATSSKP